MHLKLTQESVAKLPPSVDPRGEVIWDEDLGGFGVRIYPSGRKTFILVYGPAHRRRWITLGRYGVVTASEARKDAKTKLADLSKGLDPRAAVIRRRTMPTFRAWAKEYADSLEGKRKTLKTMRAYLELGATRFGAKALDEITPRDVDLALSAIAKRGKPTANRWLATVRAAFRTAVDKGVIDSNPVTPVRPFSESPPRTRTLSPAEVQAVVTESEKLEDPWLRALFLGLLETGCRVSELLSATWDDLDAEQGLLILRSPKAGRLQTVALPSVTLRRLAELPKLGLFIFPGRRNGTHLNRTTARLAWRDLCAAAGVRGATLHDLRRTVGLFVAREAGIAVAARVLRHSRIDVTARVYAPFGVDEQRRAAERALRRQGKLTYLDDGKKPRRKKKAVDAG